MIDNILKLKISSKKTYGLIKDINLLTVLRSTNNKVEQKIVLSVIDTVTKKEYKVSDAWINFKGKLIIRALWFYEAPDGIYSESTLAKSMKFYNIINLKDFMGKTVELYPDTKNFLTLVVTKDELV